MTRIAALPDLHAAGYVRSPLHADDCVWPEKNCYVDVWIEVLHALKLNPLAMLAFTVAVDFEDDQWTFFKPPHDELRELYGLDVQELTVWRPLLEHTCEHLAAGKLISTEADAYWLPDTAGTDYRRQHTKTTIVLADIDTQARRLGYFHNGGYHDMHGDDFAALFRLDVVPDPAYLPLFAEFIRLDRLVRRPELELAGLSVALLRRHLERAPVSNPILRFQQRFRADLPQLQEKGLAHYHNWAFGTLRQLGSAFELASLHAGWLTANGALQPNTAAAAFHTVATTTKSLILKVARAVNTGRPGAFDPAFEEMCNAWQQGTQQLREAAQTR